VIADRDFTVNDKLSNIWSDRRSRLHCHW